ncbi:TIGR01244 family sulfur transferase [Erythrobacter sp. GH1-10]|uniref:TIGR01244 family sulfur transferase n=1 Tax=Erythrobacter sp. GH1-10 TaxID=3349334 RepID=UPI003877C1A5
MEIRPVTDDLAVAPQIQPEDAQALAERGFLAVICNRPDGEEPGQPDVASIRAGVEAAGLHFHHLPVSGGAFPQAAIDAFREVRRGTPGKVLAYCRTGTRSITLETLANPRGLSVEERLENARAAGYDLSGLTDRLNAQ